MVHRGLAVLAAALMISFLILSDFEPQYFLLHFYQSLIYLAVILMLFFFEERFAYMIGMIAPAIWLVLTYATGVLGGAMRQVGILMHAEVPNNRISFLAAITAVLSIALIANCAYRWKREYAGLGKWWKTFAGSFVVVAIYYAILIYWFWNFVPQTIPRT